MNGLNSICLLVTNGLNGIQFRGLERRKEAGHDADCGAEGDGDIAILLKGKDFFPLSVVCFADEPIPSTFVSQTELRATIPAYLLRVGTMRISVINPKPHEFTGQGATSKALPFMVMFRDRGKNGH